MGVNSVFIKLGLFGGAGVDFRAMGRAAGKKAVRILQGVSASEIPIEDAWGYAIVFNLARAKMLDIQVPPDILGAAREVYNFIPGISRDKESTVFIVQSYGSGIGCGALIENGMMEMLKRSGYMDGKIRFLHFYMETERKYLSREEIEERGKLALQEIYKADPDIVVVLDDNAIEFVMLDLVGTRYPVLFGGMNVSPEYYNKKKLFMKTRQRPDFNVTGVTEEPFYEKTFKLMKYILPKATNVVFLCPASTQFLRLMGMEFEQYLRLHPELYPLHVKAFEYVTTFKRYKELIKQYDQDKEIDIIAYDDSKLVFGECKWKDNVDSEKICKELIEKIQYVDVPNNLKNHKKELWIFAKSFKSKIDQFEDYEVKCFDLSDLEKTYK